MLLEVSGEITPESYFGAKRSQSKNNTQLWMWLVMEVKSNAVKNNIASEPGMLGPWKVKESEVTQSCPTLCDPMDCNLSGFSVHGIFQARVLEWVATAFSVLLSIIQKNKGWYLCICGPFCGQILVHIIIICFLYIIGCSTSSLNFVTFHYTSYLE